MSLRDELKKTALEEQKRQEIAREEEQKRDHDKELADKIFDDLVKVISEKAQKGELSIEGLLRQAGNWPWEVEEGIKSVDLISEYEWNTGSIGNFRREYYEGYSYPIYLHDRDSRDENGIRAKWERVLNFLQQSFKAENVSCTTSIQRTFYLNKKMSIGGYVPDYFTGYLLVFIKLSWA